MTNRGRVTGRHGFEHMEVFQLALDFVEFADGVEPKLAKNLLRLIPAPALASPRARRNRAATAPARRPPLDPGHPA